MTTEQNKEMVTKTWHAFITGDLDTALDNMSDEISWVIPGSLQGVSGLKRGKAAIREFGSNIKNVFPQGLNSEIRKVHATGDDTIIVELTNQGKAVTGKNYTNEYCFIFELESGKIRRVREYVDLLTVKEAVTP
jgi:ketosteroid isomerase-like protein